MAATNNQNFPKCINAANLAVLRTTLVRLASASKYAAVRVFPGVKKPGARPSVRWNKVAKAVTLKRPGRLTVS